MVEGNEYYNSDLPYKIVESYTSPEYPHPSYDIYRVETDELTKIRVINDSSGVEYIPFETMECRSGNAIVKHVTIWTPYNAE